MRGQTTLDFATGVSVFLLTVLFVFLFIPGTLAPFTQSAQEETVATNRVADLLTQQVLADADEPYVLDGECTIELLTGGPGAGCGFDGATLPARLDISEDQSVNITMRGDGTNGVLYWDSATDRVTDSNCGSCVAFRAGERPPNSGSTVTARRIVSVDGTTAAVEVRMW
jgi:hypothetical protein